MTLPPLLCLGKIHRILRILPLNTVFGIDITVGLLPKKKTIRLTCAQTAAWLARRYIQERLRCALLCAAALLRLHLCISVSAVRVADGAASPGLHIGKCSLDALLIGSDASSVSPSSNPTGAGSGAERDARRAHVVGGERRDTHREEEKERRLSCLSSPLTLTDHHAPDQPPQSAIQAEQTSFLHYYSLLPSPNCIWDGQAVGNDRTPFEVACFTVTLLRDILQKNIILKQKTIKVRFRSKELKHSLALRSLCTTLLIFNLRLTFHPQLSLCIITVLLLFLSIVLTMINYYLHFLVI